MGTSSTVGSILLRNPRGLRVGIDGRRAGNRRALLESEERFAQSRALDCAHEPLLREIAEPALEPGEPVAQPGGIAHARDLVLAALDDPALDPGESLAQGAELTQLGHDLAHEIGETLLHSFEALAELVRVQRLAR